MTNTINYPIGQAPFELITNDILKSILIPMLGWSDHGGLARTSKTFQKRIQPFLDVEWNRILKAITFGKDKWLNIPGVASVSAEPLLTEEQIKKLTAKLKGRCQVFNIPDLAWPHRFQNDKIKRTWETHMLIFFPESINNLPRTFNAIGNLFRFEKKDERPTVFEWVTGGDRGLFRNQSASGSYWKLVPRDVFPKSRNISYTRMKDLVRDNSCIIPSPNDAATAILIMNLGHTPGNGKYFFGRGSEGENSIYTATDANYNDKLVIIGSASPSGLTVESVDYSANWIGVAGFAEVP